MSYRPPFRRAGRSFGALLPLIGLLMTGRATAQLQSQVEQAEATVPERQSVLQRSRADYDALGGRLGGFLFNSAVTVTETYNSNVYVSHASALSDLFTTVSPALDLVSDWDTHFLALHARDDTHRYDQLVSENNSDATVGLDGRLDILRNVELLGSFSESLLHELRTSPDSVGNQKSPIEYRLDSAHVTFLRDPGQLGLKLDADLDSFHYQNGVTLTGAVIPETDRNRYDFLVTPRVSYEIAKGYHAFIKFPLNSHIYQTTPDISGLDRNSRGYEIDGGTAIDLGKVVTAEIFLGYLQQHYNDAQLHPLSGLSYGANCLWNFSDVSSLRANVTHLVREAILPGVSSDLQTGLAASIEHELRRDVLISGGARYELDDFVGGARTDHNYQGELSVRYLVNHRLYFDFRGSFRARESDSSTFNYRQNILSAAIHLQQ